MNFFFPVLCFLFISFSGGPEKSPHQIDQQLKVSEMLLNNGKPKEYLEANRLIAKISSQINYSKGKAIANFRIAIALNMLGEFDRSIIHLKIAEEEKYTPNDMELMAGINRIYGDNNSKLGLFEKAIERYKKILLLNVINKPLTYGMANNNIGSTFIGMNAPDSSYIYYKRSYDILSGLLSVKEKVLKSVVCSNLSEFWQKKHRLDTAFFFSFNALKLAKETGSPYALQIATKHAGRIFLANKEGDSALTYLKQCLGFTLQTKDIYELKILYKDIYDAYILKKDDENSLKYLKLYTSTADSIVKMEKNTLRETIKANDSESLKKNITKIRILYLSGVLIAIILIIVSWFAYGSYKKQKELLQKRKQEKQEFLNALKGIRNEVVVEGLTDLIRLAKEKDPAFFIKFNDIYPDFRKKILLRVPSLNSSELEICCYIKINFNTKDIARYGDMTIKSVDSKKYRLRKKFQLAVEEDLNIWLANI